jgi:fluoroquinolone resistance protein
MNQAYFENKKFEKIDYTVNHLTKGDYEYCSFINCDFSNSDLSECKFSDCEFLGCNLSLVQLTKTAFRDITFKDCKMLGFPINNCNEIGLSFRFENCILNHSSFYKTKIKKTIFRNAQLQEVDFSESDLTDSLFDNCDLTRATFDHTILEKADFRTSFNFSIDPELNRIRKAKFSINGIAGLLEKYDISIDL